MLAKIKLLLISSRPVSWINTAYPFAAGYYMTTRSIDATLIVGTLFFLIPYNLLMYGVNDVFDYESDILNPRKGGIEGAKLPRSVHRFVLVAAGLSCLPFIIFLLSQSTPMGAIILLLTIGAVVSYSAPVLRLKERPFIDSITSSIHFVGPLVFGLSFNGYQVNYVPIILSFFLWGMASHAFGAVQDIIADRAAHLQSIATVIGARKTVRLAIGLYAAAGLLLFCYGWPGIIIGSASLDYIINIWPFRNIDDASSESANIAWRRFISLNMFTGFIITMMLLFILRFS